MPWGTAAVLTIAKDGRYIDADDAALELLGVATVAELRDMPPDAFRAAPPNQAGDDALRNAVAEAVFKGLLAESALRRPDGELVRVRTAIVLKGDGEYRKLVY